MGGEVREVREANGRNSRWTGQDRRVGKCAGAGRL